MVGSRRRVGGRGGGGGELVGLGTEHSQSSELRYLEPQRLSRLGKAVTASTARSMPLLHCDSYPYSTISEFSYRKFVNLSRMRVRTHHSSAYVRTRGDALCYCSSAHCGVMTHRGPHNVSITHPPLIYRMVALIQVHGRPNVPGFLSSRSAPPP